MESRAGRVLVLLVAAGLSAGCSSTIGTKGPASATAPAESPTALTYYQPRITYLLSGTYVLTECIGATPRVKAKVTMTPAISADPLTRQVFDPAIRADFPRLAMVNWFEWRKHEPEVGHVIDWRITADADLVRALLAEVPEGWLRFGGLVE